MHVGGIDIEKKALIFKAFFSTGEFARYFMTTKSPLRILLKGLFPLHYSLISFPKNR